MHGLESGKINKKSPKGGFFGRIKLLIENMKIKNIIFLLFDILILVWLISSDIQYLEFLIISSWVGSPLVLLILIILFKNKEPLHYLDLYNKLFIHIVRVCFLAILIFLIYDTESLNIVDFASDNFMQGVGLGTGLIFLIIIGLIFIFNLINISVDIYLLLFNRFVSSNKSSKMIKYIIFSVWMAWTIFSLGYMGAN